MTSGEVVGVLLAHMAGDYVLQSDGMAQKKTSMWRWALLHGLLYTLPFVLVTQDWRALLVIGGTHAVIDRYRLARHVTWAKEWIIPGGHRLPWAEAKATGYQADKPAWMAVWLMILVDNSLHLAINFAAVAWL